MEDALARIGRNIAALRRERSLSQEDLAHTAEVRQAYLSGLEAGKRNPTVKTLARIAEALNVSVETLFRSRS